MSTTILASSRATELNTQMSKVYGFMGLGLLITALVAGFTAGSPLFELIFSTPLKWLVLFAPIAFVFAMMLGYERFSAPTLTTLFLTYAAINGLGLSVLTAIYTMESIAVVFFLTAGLFAAMSIYGYFTKKDLTSIGQLLFWALIGVIVAMIVNIFIGSSMLTTAISCVAVLVFLGLTAYDTQKIRDILWNEPAPAKAIVMGALTLYLDFLNLFIHLLQLFGIKKE